MTRPLDVHRYGFIWGPMNVKRLATFAKGKSTSHFLGITTAHHKVEVSVSKTGRSVRVWLDGEEIT